MLEVRNSFYDLCGNFSYLRFTINKRQDEHFENYAQNLQSIISCLLPLVFLPLIAQKKRLCAKCVKPFLTSNI